MRIKWILLLLTILCLIPLVQGTAFFEAYYHNHTATTLPFSIADQYYFLFLTNYTDTVDFDIVNTGFGENTTILVNTTGNYSVDYFASGSGQNNHEYALTLFVNDVAEDKCEVHRKLNSGGDIITMPGSCVLNLNDGDNVSMRIADLGDTGNGMYYLSNIRFVEIEEQDETANVAIALILTGLIFFLVYLSKHFGEEHQVIKSLLTFFAFILVTPIIWISRTVAATYNTTVSNLIEYIFYGYIPVLTFLFYYLIIYTIKEIVVNFMIGRKQKRGDFED